MTALGTVPDHGPRPEMEMGDPAGKIPGNGTQREGDASGSCLASEFAKHRIFDSVRNLGIDGLCTVKQGCNDSAPSDEVTVSHHDQMLGFDPEFPCRLRARPSTDINHREGTTSSVWRQKGQTDPCQPGAGKPGKGRDLPLCKREDGSGLVPVGPISKISIS